MKILLPNPDSVALQDPRVRELIQWCRKTELEMYNEADDKVRKISGTGKEKRFPPGRLLPPRVGEDIRDPEVA